MVSNFSVSGNFLVFRANIAVPKVCSIFFHAAMATTKHQKLEGGGGKQWAIDQGPQEVALRH